MADFDARFNIGDSTPDVIIENGRYWQDEAIFSAYKLKLIEITISTPKNTF